MNVILDAYKIIIKSKRLSLFPFLFLSVLASLILQQMLLIYLRTEDMQALLLLLPSYSSCSIASRSIE
jgi:hypothetical protein